MLAYQTVVNSDAPDAAVADIQNVLDLTAQAQTALIDMQNSYCGHLLSGHESSLHPY